MTETEKELTQKIQDSIMDAFTKEELVKAIEYTGTIESYNQLIDYIESSHPGLQKPMQATHYIWFVNEQGESTMKFTGTVVDTISGITYSPGDTFLVKNNDD